MKNELNVGKTPLVMLREIMSSYDTGSSIFAKLENENPAGSIKDRVALQMILDYENDGKITSDTTIIEPTSGNTGIGLAYVCKSRGYKAVIVMPDSMSRERIELIESYGAQVVLTKGALGMAGAIAMAKKLQKSIPNSIIAGQFENPSNPRAHYLTTAPELYEQLDGRVDIVVCGIGTGGTITGISRYLKEKNKSITVVGIEPKNSAVLSGGKAGVHGLQGIGAGFIPGVLDVNSYDKIITVSDKDAYKMTREVYEKEGIMVGISSGAALCGAVLLAKEHKDKRIAVIFPDTGTRYLSLGLFD